MDKFEVGDRVVCIYKNPFQDRNRFASSGDIGTIIYCDNDREEIKTYFIEWDIPCNALSTCLTKQDLKFKPKSGEWVSERRIELLKPMDKSDLVIEWRYSDERV